MKLFREILARGDDVPKYISRIKNMHYDIIGGEFPKVEEGYLVFILINDSSPSYKHFIEISQITNKL